MGVASVVKCVCYLIIILRSLPNVMACTVHCNHHYCHRQPSHRLILNYVIR